MRYVALLRGVNVGGANKIGMKELAAAFEEAGMTSVRTYINSGNVVFETELQDRDDLAATLDAAIAGRFGFSGGMLLLDAARVRSIAGAIPREWADDASMKCDVLYLWPDVDRPQVVDGLEHDPVHEDVRYVPGAVVHRVDRVYASRTRFTKIVGTPLYKRLTVRNCNTARKLAELVSAGDEG